MNTGWKTYLSGDSEGSLEWLSQVETLQISTFHPKYPAQLGNICPRVPRQWQILVPAPWLHMIFLTLFRVEQLWSHLTVLPTTRLCSSRMAPKHLGGDVRVGKIPPLSCSWQWRESIVPSAPAQCLKGAGVQQVLIPRDLVSSSESCWLIQSENLALRFNRWGNKWTVYCVKSVGKQKLQKSPNLDFGQATSISNAILDERSKFCWRELKARISKIGRM